MKAKLINEVGEKTYAIVFDKGDEVDHDAERRQMQKMLVLTGNYTGPAEATNVFDSLFRRIEALELDMRLHVHLEDHILFPRVGVLEASSW